MTQAEIIAWTKEAARRVAEDKTGTPLTQKQLQRVAELKRKAPKRGWKKWLTWPRATEPDDCDQANRKCA
jgi:hypothetical protein